MPYAPAVMTLHRDELRINELVVGNLLSEQIPEWADLPLSRLETTRTVNVAYRLGDDKLVRLPRTIGYGDGPEREATWLPVFAPAVPLEVPEHLAPGRPTKYYPCHWSVLRWIEGTNANAVSLNDLDVAAEALGDFVVALRSVPTDGAPRSGSYRGFGLAGVYESFHRWLNEVSEDEIDVARVRRIWEEGVAVEECMGPPKWFHGDLQPGNLIARDGDLVAVIDWEGCTVGDPSSDLLAAWWLFEADSRETFRSATGAATEEWRRAKGGALFMAIAAIPYYADANPGFASSARKALQEVLADN